LAARGDVAGVTRRWLDGSAPALRRDPALEAWPLAPGLASLAGDSTGSGGVVTMTDSSRSADPLEVILRPRSLALGVGASTGADPDGLWELVIGELIRLGLDPLAVGVVATIDRKAAEPAIVALATRLGTELSAFDADTLGRMTVPNPSATVAAAVGTPSVAEAAALLAGGAGATLVSGKAVSATRDSTVAICRRVHPVGHLAVVGLGPGDPALRTPAATIAIRSADVVIGYGPYVDAAGDLLSAHQQVVRSPIGAEADRCREALGRATAGSRVALVCSGDPGVYAMASLVCELAPDHGDPPIEVVPGVTAALSAAAVLGAPLGHDHAAISLSDLLCPWDVIVRRLQAAAEGDFVVTLYNPRSEKRSSQLGEALSILAAHRPPSTPAAILTSVGRPGADVVRATLATIDPTAAGMMSVVVIGSSATRWIGPRMVTPRGYGAT
jgi:cobalt-precorrin 5A hydrolase / cobalt-factor III methyltransferase / precorrin-3B C17-methyltransferase